MEFEKSPIPKQETAGSDEKEKELSPALQEIKNMELAYNEEEFEKAAHEEAESTKTSADAFLRSAKRLIDGERPGPNTFGAMLRILERPSMQDHPQIDLFKKAVDELAEKYGKEL